LNKQPKYIETIILSERGKRRDSLCFFHISTNIEMLYECQDEAGGLLLPSHVRVLNPHVYEIFRLRFHAF
jgi:hypothetical protein